MSEVISEPCWTGAASRAFKVWTEEGSFFAMRLDPKEVWYGMQLGILTIHGYAVTTNCQLEQRGIGAAPEPGGQVRVSLEPYQIEKIHDEQVPYYRTETIVRVEELAVPEAALRTKDGHE